MRESAHCIGADRKQKRAHLLKTRKLRPRFDLSHLIADVGDTHTRRWFPQLYVYIYMKREDHNGGTV